MYLVHLVGSFILYLRAGKKMLKGQKCHAIVLMSAIQTCTSQNESSLWPQTAENKEKFKWFRIFHTYCYKSLTNSLAELLNRPNLLKLCECWKTLASTSDKLCDVYDGQMWHKFMYDDKGNPFLLAPNNFLLQLNCDWFQPFKHTQHSVGVLYVAVENL